MADQEIQNSEENLDDLSFKQGLAELDQIVRQLESGQLELEQSLVSYERGVKLIAMLRGRLDTAQLKVTSLMEELAPDASDADASQVS